MVSILFEWSKIHLLEDHGDEDLHGCISTGIRNSHSEKTPCLHGAVHSSSNMWVALHIEQNIFLLRRRRW